MLDGMGCCIAIALLISLIRKAWYAVPPGRRLDTLPLDTLPMNGHLGHGPAGWPCTPPASSCSRPAC